MRISGYVHAFEDGQFIECHQFIFVAVYVCKLHLYWKFFEDVDYGANIIEMFFLQFDLSSRDPFYSAFVVTG